MKGEHSELTTVYEAGSSGQAYLIRDMLIDSEVHAVVSGEFSEAAPIAPITDGPTVQVREADRERALALIKEYEEETIHDEDESGASPEPSWTCAKCGRKVDGNFAVCWNCEAERPSTPPTSQ